MPSSVTARASCPGIRRSSPGHKYRRRSSPPRTHTVLAVRDLRASVTARCWSRSARRAPSRLTVAFFDSILNVTMTDTEYERYRPLLATVLGLEEDNGPHAAGAAR